MRMTPLTFPSLKLFLSQLYSDDDEEDDDEDDEEDDGEPEAKKQKT